MEQLWKLNNSILSDKLFVLSLENGLLNLVMVLDICIDVWDYFKENIKTFCIDYCKKKNRIKHAVIKDLEKRYFRLCKLESKSPGNYNEQISVLKDEIKQYYLNDFRGSQIRGEYSRTSYLLDVYQIEAIYKTGEGVEWYVSFKTEKEADTVGFGNGRGVGEEGSVALDRIDSRIIRLRVHWFPHHMRKALVCQWLQNFGQNVRLEEEATLYEGIMLKTGTLVGTMKKTEAQYQSIPHSRRCYNRDVLVTVQGRQSLCLRCNQFGHHKATCPETVVQNKTYAQMARLDTGGSAGDAPSASV
ncbi:unnamed protein product [Mytilus edulis]|uniref:CCHC-type domain-containing protein n=1 Tax=Mytilus edulis TaxID=6550 RepID=A0A8S3UFL2_MYTED|nr:unnamed protein product [Mytilus edulis]